MPLLDRLMNELELKPEDIDYYAVSVGPGSFTGLRIGVATIKAIAYACDKPAVAVPTLDAMAWGLSEFEGNIVPIMDARNDQVFTAIYLAKEGMIEKSSDYLGIHVDELLDLVSNKKGRILFTGDAIAMHSDKIKQVLGNRASFAPTGRNLNRASDVAFAASVMIDKGEVCSPMDLVPFYLRKSQAERLREQK